MRKSLILLTLVRLVAFGSSAPVCTVFDSDQDVFSHVDREDISKPDDDGGIIYFPLRKHCDALNFEDRMKSLILNEIEIRYDHTVCMRNLSCSNFAQRWKEITSITALSMSFRLQLSE